VSRLPLLRQQQRMHIHYITCNARSDSEQELGHNAAMAWWAAHGVHRQVCKEAMPDPAMQQLAGRIMRYM
jgi:hypothetical protein